MSLDDRRLWLWQEAQNLGSNLLERMRFEIARYDVYGNHKDEDTPTHTSWAATLYNREWDSTLAGSSQSDIGILRRRLAYLIVHRTI